MSETASRFVDNHGVRIHYLDSGPTPSTARPPVVFIPGMSCVAEDYRPLLNHFRRRTVVVDLRGHGLSDSPTTGYSLEDQAGDIAAVVDAVTDGPVHVMTFSRGTCYALAWASAQTRRVLSIAIGDYPAREIDLPAEAAENFVTGRWRGTPVVERVTKSAARATFAEAAERPLWAELAALAVPTLVVRSSAEAPLTDDDWSHYRREIPSAELVEFADAPHDLFRHDRLRYPDLVATHMDRADAAGRRPLPD